MPELLNPFDLRAEHLGRLVRVTERSRIVEGHLADVKHSAELVEEGTLCSIETMYVCGDIHTTLDVSGVSIHASLSVPNVKVEVLS